MVQWFQVHYFLWPLIFLKEMLNSHFQHIIQPSEETNSIILNTFAKKPFVNSFIQAFIWWIMYSSTFNLKPHVFSSTALLDIYVWSVLVSMVKMWKQFSIVTNINNSAHFLKFQIIQTNNMGYLTLENLHSYTDKSWKTFFDCDVYVCIYFWIFSSFCIVHSIVISLLVIWNFSH